MNEKKCGKNHVCLIKLTLGALVTEHINTIISLLVDDIPVTVHLEHMISSALVGYLTVVELNVVTDAAVGGSSNVHTES